MTENTYKWDPEDYAEHSTAQYDFAKELLRRLNLRGDETILDIGCGDGKITLEIAKLVPNGKTVGIDNSQEMLGFARTKFPSSLYPNLEFKLMDARKIDFDEKFDLVVSNSALHWLTDHRPVLQGIRKCLKPGGKALLHMAGKGNILAIVPAIGQIIGDPRWCDGIKNFRSPYGFYSADEYMPWIQEAGLKPIHVELARRELALHGRKGFLGWLRTTWLPFIQCVPKEHQEDFIAAIADKYFQIYPVDPSGIIGVPTMRLEVEAEKAP